MQHMLRNIFIRSLIAVLPVVYFLMLYTPETSNEPIVVIDAENFSYSAEKTALSSLNLEGFSAIEEWGVWANNASVQIRLPFAVSVATSLTICGSELYAGQLERALVRVAETTRKFAFESDGCFKSDYDWLDRNIIIYDIALDSPKALGMNEDRRKLGFALVKVAVTTN